MISKKPGGKNISKIHNVSLASTYRAGRSVMCITFAQILWKRFPSLIIVLRTPLERLWRMAAGKTYCSRMWWSWLLRPAILNSPTCLINVELYPEGTLEEDTAARKLCLLALLKTKSAFGLMKSRLCVGIRCKWCILFACSMSRQRTVVSFSPNRCFITLSERFLSMCMTSKVCRIAAPATISVIKKNEY